MERIKLGLSKLLSLRPRDWADLLVAQAALLRAQLLVWTRPRGALVSPRPSVPTAPLDASAPNTVAPPVAQRFALAIARAARYGVFRPACLVRAVALQRLLRQRGLSEGTVRLGVRRENGKLLAHAWVDYLGAILADEEWHVKRFDELASLDMYGAP